MVLAPAPSVGLLVVAALAVVAGYVTLRYHRLDGSLPRDPVPPTAPARCAASRRRW